MVKADYDNPWILNGNPFVDPEEWVGMVYLITCIPTGQKYVGKKLFAFSRKRKVKGRNRRVKSASDWKTYYSSSEILQKLVNELGPDCFTREILHLCANRTAMSYLELKEQVQRGVLESDEFLNEWVYVRVRKSQLNLTSEPRKSKQPRKRQRIK